MELAQLEAKLAAARQLLEKAMDASTAVPVGGKGDEYEAAYQAVLTLERDVALAKGEEAAFPCEWEPRWDIGAPLPHVFSDGNRTLLIYIVHEPDPDWDGTYVKVVDPASEEAEAIAIVEFDDCSVFKFGDPNDEVLNGLPWYGKGLEFYRAHEIANSNWIQEMMCINSVHDHYDSSRWDDTKHYVLPFHNDMFECLARGYSIQVMRKSFAEAIELAVKRLQSDGRDKD